MLNVEIGAFDEILILPVGMVRLEIGVLVYTPILDVHIVEHIICVPLKEDTITVDAFPTFVNILESCKEDTFIRTLDDILVNTMILLAVIVEPVKEDVVTLLVRIVEMTACET